MKAELHEDANQEAAGKYVEIENGNIKSDRVQLEVGDCSTGRKASDIFTNYVIGRSVVIPEGADIEATLGFCDTDFSVNSRRISTMDMMRYNTEL
jgi:hypothetical protein